MLCLGLDIGSTSIKGAVLDVGSERIVRTAARPFPAPLPATVPGSVEVSPEAILTQTGAVLDEVLDAAPKAASLWCCGQMGGTLLVNADGEPLSNYLSWRDQRTLQAGARGKTALDEIRERWPAERLSQLGNELQPGSTTSLLFWLSQHGQLPADAVPVSIADFVLGRLCKVQPKMHVTHAIGMLDLRSGQWHREAFDSLGLARLRLPQLLSQVEPIGQVTRRGRTLEVYGSFGDQQSALYGAGLQRGELSLNISTGSQVSLRTDCFQPGRYQTRMFFAGDWLNTITHLPAGRSLNVLVDLLTELASAEGITLQNPWQHILRKTAEIKHSSLEADLAFFAGPLGETGSIRGITTENLSVGHLFHAAFRAMAENYATCADWLDPQRRWSSVVLSGGLTQSAPMLKEMLQQRFAAPLRESSSEETLLGLLRLAKSHAV
jgi:sugar (pentulose or hexulose) kinase